MNKVAYLDYVHNFRGLAILYVVLIHIAIVSYWGSNRLSEQIILIFFSNGTILFVFISGFLFYHLGHMDFDFFNYLKKRFQYVIVPYLIISIPAVVDKLFFDSVGEHWWLTQSFWEKPMVLKVLILLTTGYHNGVLWFIPMISIIYLLSWVIMRFANTISFNYAAPLIVGLGFFLNSYGYRSNILLSFLFFVPVFIFGIWMCKIKEQVFKVSRLVIFLAGVLYLGMTLLEFFNYNFFEESLRLRDLNKLSLGLNINKVKLHILCVFFLLFFRVFFFKKSYVLGLLGNYSFGIYFIHLYVITLIDRFGGMIPFLSGERNLGSFLVIGAIVVLVSVMLVYLTKWFLGEKSRFVIGS